MNTDISKKLAEVESSELEVELNVANMASLSETINCLD